MSDQIYRFAAPYFEIDRVVRFLGFANNETGQYLWFQRADGTEDEVVPYADNVWIERDDQGWGGHGGINEIILRRKKLMVLFTPQRAGEMGGFDIIEVKLFLTDEDFEQVQRQLFHVFAGYEDILDVAY